ncbi:MAG: carboxypeptidase-like regulatory domain-containing protein, partial [Chitinophagaceae bacterium]|nr:carboxypeptidase-like regulatory domain-containing protein [Chitinophagaceae bacterium]
MNVIETTATPNADYLCKKITRMMKLTIALLFFTCLQVSARGWSQERITLRMSETEIRKVLFAIEKSSKYRFLFNESALKNKPRVSIVAEDEPVTEVLDKVLANTGISYKILSTNLVVLKEGVPASAIMSAEVRVTGRVTNAAGEPLSGASVTLKGSRTGTTTDPLGNFSITVPDDAVLVISSVGYDPVEISVAGRTSIEVSLQESTKKMDEVVVIGYGTAAKRDLTGSITKVSGKEVADKPNPNPVSSLQGK